MAVAALVVFKYGVLHFCIFFVDRSNTKRRQSKISDLIDTKFSVVLRRAATARYIVHFRSCHGIVGIFEGAYAIIDPAGAPHRFVYRQPFSFQVASRISERVRVTTSANLNCLNINNGAPFSDCRSVFIISATVC